jgi:hypothetical protein
MMTTTYFDGWEVSISRSLLALLLDSKALDLDEPKDAQNIIRSIAEKEYDGKPGVTRLDITLPKSGVRASIVIENENC